MKHLSYFLLLVTLCVAIVLDIRPSQFYSPLVSFLKKGDFDVSILDMSFFFLAALTFPMFINKVLWRRTESFNRPLYRGFILFIFIGVLLPLVIGIYRVHAESGTNLSRVFSEFRPMAYYLLYFPLYYVVRSEERVKTLSNYFLLFMIILCLEQVVFLFRYSSIGSVGELRDLRYLYFGFFTMRYELLFLPLSIMMSYLWFIDAELSWSKMLAVFLFLLMLFVVFLTATRSILLITFVGLVFLYLLMRRKRILFRKRKRIWFESLLLISTCVCFYGILQLWSSVSMGIESGVGSYLGDMVKMTTRDDPSIIYRIEESAMILHEIHSAPLFGHGFAKEVYIPMLGFLHSGFHNVYLNMTLKTGFLGLLTFLYVLFKAAKLLWLMYFKSNDPFVVKFSAVLFIWLFLLFLQGFIGNAFMANKITLVITMTFVFTEVVFRSFTKSDNRCAVI